VARPDILSGSPTWGEDRSSRDGAFYAPYGLWKEGEESRFFTAGDAEGAEAVAEAGMTE
jgi:hypothetical protein